MRSNKNQSQTSQTSQSDLFDAMVREFSHELDALAPSEFTPLAAMAMLEAMLPHVTTCYLGMELSSKYNVDSLIENNTTRIKIALESLRAKLKDRTVTYDDFLSAGYN